MRIGVAVPMSAGDAPPMPTGVRLGDLKLLYPADWDDYAAQRDVFSKEWNGMLGL